MLARDVGEAIAKLATAKTWPELFGELSREQILKLSLACMETAVEHHLLYSTGKSTPNGIAPTRN